MIMEKCKDQPIMDWLYAGPYIIDVTDKYYDNYIVPFEPYKSYWEEAKQNITNKESYPVEGDEIPLFGNKKEWQLLRPDESEKRITWADVRVNPRLLASYAYSRIIVDKPGKYKAKLYVSGSMALYINGHEAFSVTQVGRIEKDYSIELELKKGVNHLMLLLLNVHVICKISFSITIEGLEYKADLPLITKDIEERLTIEQDIRSFYMKNNMLTIGDKVVLNVDQMLKSGSRFVFSITYEDRKMADIYDPITVFTKEVARIPADCREIYICDSDLLEWEGKYNLNVNCLDSENNLIKGIKLPLKKDYYVEDVPEGNYQNRMNYLYKMYSDYNENEVRLGTYKDIYYELAKLEAKRYDLLNEKRMEDAINYINTRYDCADFALHGLLRLYCKYKDSELISTELKEKMKRCILDFKYAPDEPGKSMMFTRSENHEMLFYSAEYIAGLLFPTENFSNSNQNGLFHALKGRLNAERWIKEKGTYGFMEWHSNNYYEEDLVALLSIYDLGEENSYIRILAKNLLDLLCVLIATHSYKGVMGTTHGRCYEESLLHPELEVMSHINWLLMGQPKKLAKRVSIGAVSLASSKYKPDPYIEMLGNSEEELYTLTRMGLFPKEGLGGVNCATFRTKDYMVSGLVESRKGRFGYQTQAGQVLLDGNIPVFVSCFDNKSVTTSPSYWGGQYRMPKTITYKNMLAYIYNIDTIAGYTHCYFPFDSFDQTVEMKKWLFGRKNDAYIALFSLKPYIKVEEGEFKDKELLCMEKRNIWLIEVGNKEKWGSFEQFMSAFLNAKIEISGEDLIFESPSNGIVELGWDKSCTVNGKPVMESDFPLIHNQYIHGEYGDGITYIDIDSHKKILNFKI